MKYRPATYTLDPPEKLKLLGFTQPITLEQTDECSSYFSAIYTLTAYMTPGYVETLYDILRNDIVDPETEDKLTFNLTFRKDKVEDKGYVLSGISFRYEDISENGRPSGKYLEVPRGIEYLTSVLQKMPDQSDPMGVIGGVPRLSFHMEIMWLRQY